MNKLPVNSTFNHQRCKFTLLERFENFGLFKIIDVLDREFYSTARIVDESFIDGYSTDSPASKSYDDMKVIFDAEIQRVKDDRLKEIAREEEKKEVERLQAIRYSKNADAMGQIKAYCDELRKLIAEAKDFKSAMKSSRVKELLAEVTAIERLVSLI